MAMNKFCFLLILALVCFSCKKDRDNPVIEPEAYSSATYQVTVTGKWNATDFEVPPGVHFTRLAGAVHNREVSLWKEGALASPNLEALAENGRIGPMLAQVDSLISAGKALARLTAEPPLPTGDVTFTVNADTDFANLSFASMLAPTPDWFFGVSGLALYRNKSWITDTTIQLYSFDAGTEEGNVFGYNNPETVPQQPIHLLNRTNASVLFKGLVLPIAEMRIVKQ
jgi:hypothetical protein